MEEKINPYLGYEGALFRLDRANRRLWILCIILIVLLVGSNIAWLKYESQFQEVETTTQTITQDVDAGKNGNAIINDGVHINDGKSETDNQDNNGKN